MKVKKLVSKMLASNTFVLTKNGKAIIVDAGVEVEEVKKATIGHEVVATFLTHAHFDHAFYANDYAKEFGCRVYINKNGKDTLENPDYNYGEGFAVKDFSNYEFIDGDGQFAIDEFSVQYFHCPGHCDCLTCYLIDDHLFVGDCVFKKGIGRCDLATSNQKDMPKSLEKLSKLSFKICHCGHYEDADYMDMMKNLKVYIKFLNR